MIRPTSEGLDSRHACPRARRRVAEAEARHRPHPVHLCRHAFLQSCAGPRQPGRDAGHAGLAQGGDALLAGLRSSCSAPSSSTSCSALYKLSLRLTWKLPLWEAAQIVSGLSIPLFLITHVVFNRGAASLAGTNDTYAFELANIWPGLALEHGALLLCVWVHGCIGIHYWLSLAPWYPQRAPAAVRAGRGTAGDGAGRLLRGGPAGGEPRSPQPGAWETAADRLARARWRRGRPAGHPARPPAPDVPRPARAGAAGAGRAHRAARHRRPGRGDLSRRARPCAWRRARPCSRSAA